MKMEQIQKALIGFRYQASGRISAMTVISIPMSVIRFRWIRHMCRRRIRVERMFMNLSITEMQMHLRHFLISRAWIPAFMYG